MKRYLLLVLGLFLATASYGFELRTANEISPSAFLKWDVSNGPIQITLNSRGSKDLPIGAVETSLRGAIQTWQNVPGKSYQLVYRGQSAAAVANPTDGTNSVVWMEKDWPYSPEIISVTSFSYYIQDPPQVIDADIVLNSKFHYNTTGIHAVNLRKVLLHELGHALGLSHTSVPTASLFPYFNVTTEPSLNADDRAGINYLYGVRPTDLRPITPLNNAHYMVSTSANRLPFPIFRWGRGTAQSYWVEFSATADFHKKIRYSSGSSNYYPLQLSQEQALWNLSSTRKIYWRVASISQHSPARILYLQAH